MSSKTNELWRSFCCDLTTNVTILNLNKIAFKTVCSIILPGTTSFQSVFVFLLVQINQMLHNNDAENV